MCNPLTVACTHSGAATSLDGDHELTLDELVLPCKRPGSPACQAGIEELKDFQNAATTCAGRALGLAGGAAEQVCLNSLKPYGESLYRVQIKRGWGQMITGYLPKDWPSMREAGTYASNAGEVWDTAVTGVKLSTAFGGWRAMNWYFGRAEESPEDSSEGK